MELDIWQGGWGLPSVDLNCLETLAYAKFSGVQLKINETNRPWCSQTGKLPVFKHGNKLKLHKLSDIVAHLRQQNYSADFNLSEKENADAIAYISLLEDRLRPALTYIWWLDPTNYIKVTRPWYAKALPFPYNYFVPGQMQRSAKMTVNSRFSENYVLPEQIENAVYKDAQICLNLLSERLGDKDFFFGKSPTSLDAVVFGYLAPLLKVPFPSCSLQNHLKACDNLTRFVTRILQQYFPHCRESESHQSENPRKDIGAVQDSESSQSKWRNIISTVLFATVAMIGYAFASGLVQVVIEDEEDELEESHLDEEERAALREARRSTDVVDDEDGDDEENEFT